MNKIKTIHYISGDKVDEEELDWYYCYHCGTYLKDYEWGFREDAYGNYYCDSEQECRDALVDYCNHIEYTKEEKTIKKE